MRKFLAVGISTISALTLTVGLSTVTATADIQDDACAQLPNKLVASQAAVDQAGNTLTSATSTLTTRRTELDAAVVSYVNAFGDLIIAKDAGTGETVAQAAFDAASENVAGKATAWGNAKIALFNAQHDKDIADTVHLMNNTLNTKLACGGT